MVGGNTDVCDPQEFFLIPQTEVAEVRGKAQQNEFDGDTVIVLVDNCAVGVHIRLPASRLKIDP